ncbi:MAG: PAS domain S-box protein, partial [Ktedonobacteraceae bacterium]|nr:PAS domain S-box protein [Ktedonobacteraceae bacterium]
MRKRFQYLSGMIATTSDAIIAVDNHFHLLELNPSAEQVLRVTANEVIGRECSEVLACQNLNR